MILQIKLKLYLLSLPISAMLSPSDAAVPACLRINISGSEVSGGKKFLTFISNSCRLRT